MTTKKPRKKKESAGYVQPVFEVGDRVEIRVSGTKVVGTVETVRPDGKLEIMAPARPDATQERRFVRSPLLCSRVKPE